MALSITVAYELHPPADIPASTLEATKQHVFPVGDAHNQAGKVYYEALRGAITQAKDTIGEELTAWRDAVGSREQAKESKTPGMMVKKAMKKRKGWNDRRLVSKDL